MGKGKLIIIGGTSSSGKTTICDYLKDTYQILNRRIHKYMLKEFEKNNVQYTMDNWEKMLPNIIKKIIKFAEINHTITCDKHFAIQPKLDTAYATKQNYIEDTNEPYIKGINDCHWTLPEFSSVNIYMILMQSKTTDILLRRNKSAKIKQPRSIHTKSIEKEKMFEEKYFAEAANITSKLHNARITKINNSQGNLEQTIKNIINFCEIK